jgi:hypothetical protein
MGRLLADVDPAGTESDQPIVLGRLIIIRVRRKVEGGDDSFRSWAASVSERHRSVVRNLLKAVIVDLTQTVAATTRSTRPARAEPATSVSIEPTPRAVNHEVSCHLVHFVQYVENRASVDNVVYRTV